MIDTNKELPLVDLTSGVRNTDHKRAACCHQSSGVPVEHTISVFLWGFLAGGFFTIGILLYAR